MDCLLLEFTSDRFCFTFLTFFKWPNIVKCIPIIIISFFQGLSCSSLFRFWNKICKTIWNVTGFYDSITNMQNLRFFLIVYQLAGLWILTSACTLNNIFKLTTATILILKDAAYIWNLHWFLFFGKKRGEGVNEFLMASVSILNPHWNIWDKNNI